MLYIRADGNSQIGAGHLMRCLSIADAAAAQGIRLLFLLADGQGEALVRSRGYHCRILHTDYSRMEEELPMLEPLLKEDESSFVLIDSYFADNRYLQAVGRWSGTAYLDDFGRETLCADLIINYNIYAPRLPYRKLYRKNPARLLLGSAYAPLRQDFGRTAYERKEVVENILITTGGADCYDVAGQLAERIAEYLPTAYNQDGQERAALPKIHIVSGLFYGSRDRLAILAKKYSNIVIHENVTNMSELMASCDMAISAAGSTLYELCAIGVPAVYFYFVENQELPARYFAVETRMQNAGSYTKDAQKTLRQLTKESIRLLQSAALRREVSESMRSVSDGKGAERIAGALRLELRRQDTVSL